MFVKNSSLKGFSWGFIPYLVPEIFSWFFPPQTFLLSTRSTSLSRFNHLYIYARTHHQIFWARESFFPDWETLSYILTNTHGIHGMGSIYRMQKWTKTRTRKIHKNCWIVCLWRQWEAPLSAHCLGRRFKWFEMKAIHHPSDVKSNKIHGFILLW